MPIATLEHVSVGAPITRCGVSLIPVYVHQHAPAIATGPATGVVIEEQAVAEVPTLVARNDGTQPVLLVQGEVVMGGRQHRVVNVSILVPAGATTQIPVSCVEQGRWGGGLRFDGGRMLATRNVRRTTARTVVERLADGDKRADQGAVWAAVHHELGRLGLASETGAFTAAGAVFDRDAGLAAAADEIVAAGPLPGQCGLVVAHGSRIVAADVFSSADALACQWEPLVRAHVLDAPERVQGTPSLTRAVRFLRRFATAPNRVAPGVGLGREHHVSTPKVVGQALVWDDVLVHASMFAVAA